MTWHHNLLEGSFGVESKARRVRLINEYDVKLSARNKTYSCSTQCIFEYEGPERVNWELRFAYFSWE